MTLTLAAATAFVACGTEGLLQGESYRPEGRLPIEPPSEREAGFACDGGTCDGGPADAPILPIGDASVEPSNTCLTARDIGTISGDTAATSATAQGTCSEWLRLRATENNSTATGVGMKAKLTLTPAGGNFDLYVFYDPVRDVSPCNALPTRSVEAGAAVETLSLSWGEGTVANGTDDSRTLAVAVIKTGGPCGADGGTWTFLAEGNR